MGPKNGCTPSGSDGSLSVVPRSRKHHTRSRTGCLTCRQRHLRCDEKRPTCINCSSASKACEYPALGPLLRDRRKAWLPGEQQPWTTQSSQMPMVISFEMDPFNALPNRMPFRSNELFHYFCKAQDSIGYKTSYKEKDCLALATQNPDSLRGSLLIAALHYAWNVGNLQNYESTFLFHKVEAMRLVNEWLKNLNPKLATACIREICTLAFTECCLGDVNTANTHIDGLLRFMDFHKPTALEIQPKLGLEDEFANRYILFTYSFVHGLKSRVSDLVSSDCEPTPEDIERLMHNWHIEEKDGLEIRLQSMRLFPSFFSVPPRGTECQDIDALPLVECLRKFTQMAHIRIQLGAHPIGDRRDQIWLEGAATRLLLVMVNSHVQSTSGGRRQTPGQKLSKRLRVSWSGASAAIGLYLNAVLGIWNAGQLLDDRLHRRVLFILKGDLDREDYLLEPGNTATSDFWFWRAFTGAFSIEKHRKHREETMSASFQPSFRSFIVAWIRKTKTYEWASAKKSLESIVWPPQLVDEFLAVEIWQDAALEAVQRQVSQCNGGKRECVLS